MDKRSESVLLFLNAGKKSTDHSFPRSRRLSKSADYAFVFARPAKLADAIFTVLVRPNEIGRARLGLAISKKNIKTAVARNRIKRLIRESFRQHLFLLSSVDIIVLAKRGADKKNSQTVRRSLRTHWKRLVG
jgi:ribonuclease P protein component